MDIRQLRRFVTVAELGSFNKAAELLYVSQPSLTRSIQLLEEALDAKLFERGARGVSLTAMGDELLPHARIILHERDRAMSAIDSIRGRQASAIIIGAEAPFTINRLPKVISKLMDSFPDIRINVVEDVMGNMLDRIREGSLTFALGSRAPYLDCKDIIFDPIYDESAVIILRAEHPLLANGMPSLEQLSQARWVVPDDVIVSEGWTSMFTRHNMPVPEQVLKTSSLHLKRACLLKSDFVSLADYTTYQEEIEQGLLVKMDFSQPYSRPSGIFRRVGSKLSRHEKNLLALLKQG